MIRRDGGKRFFGKGLGAARELIRFDIGAVGVGGTFAVFGGGWHKDECV